MQKPDIPKDEPIRLKTLRSLHILDTPSEERFDRLARMAKRLFRVPIALVSLIDENRQWFKSRIGLDACETPRDISFCGHAILGNGVLIIPDAAEDPRFADNPLVVGDPDIRFYAGCPLTAPNGSKLGTLCIIDHKPRHFGQDDIEAMQDLAAMVERELAAVHLATQDDLTHLSNRRGFMALAQHSLHLCARQGLPASLVFFDLDAFKPINDRFGHAEGDRALVDFAQLMQSHFRESDLLGRLGGDEFVVLFVNTTQPSAQDIVDKFRQSLEALNLRENRGYSIRFSCGIVEFSPEKAPSIEDLLAEGDRIMYAEKQGKR
jgi:diguanylate cyclase (GGDEF)-like protein